MACPKGRYYFANLRGMSTCPLFQRESTLRAVAIVREHIMLSKLRICWPAGIVARNIYPTISAPIADITVDEKSSKSSAAK
jgi:hypothetical protein